MNMFKKNGGFTLVELIVVIAILAILAGVAVPVYSGYIAKANSAADYTQLDSVKTAAFFAVAETDAAAKVTEITVTQTTTDGVTATTYAADYIASTDVNSDNKVDSTDVVEDANITTAVQNLVGGEIGAFKSGETTATWTEAEGWELG